MLESAIISELDKEFDGIDWRSLRRFAVRSSAVGEDSEELSAAGQNEARKFGFGSHPEPEIDNSTRPYD